MHFLYYLCICARLFLDLPVYRLFVYFFEDPLTVEPYIRLPPRRCLHVLVCPRCKAKALLTRASLFKVDQTSAKPSCSTFQSTPSLGAGRVEIPRHLEVLDQTGKIFGAQFLLVKGMSMWLRSIALTLGRSSCY